MSVNTALHETFCRRYSFSVRNSTSFVSKGKTHWCLSPKLNKQCEFRRASSPSPSSNFKQIEIPKKTRRCARVNHVLTSPASFSCMQRFGACVVTVPLEWTGVCNIIIIKTCVNGIACLVECWLQAHPLCARSLLTSLTRRSMCNCYLHPPRAICFIKHHKCT
jgi:hypothetical protein